MLPQTYFDKVREHFNGDTARTWMWLKSPNSNLGSVSPLEMVKVGRTNKLIEYIDGALKGRYRL